VNKLGSSVCLMLCVGMGGTGTAVADNRNAEDFGTIQVEGKDEKQQLERSPFPVSVIDASRFHGRSISLNDVLKRVAGVRVTQQGGLGSRSTIAIQGLEGKRIKIFIDGDPLNSPDGSFGINDIPIQLIDRIEIYKGVVPARFGGDAMGGAVNVVTREFDGDWLDVSGTFSSYNTQRLTGVVTKKFDDLGIEIGAGGFYNHSDNDYTMESPHVDGLKIKRDHDAFTSYAAAVAAKIEDRYFDEIEIELVNYQSEKEIQGIEYAIRDAKQQSTANIAGVALEKSDFLTRNLTLDYSLALVKLATRFIDKATTCYDFSGGQRPCSGSGGEIGDYPRDSDDKQDELRHDLDLRYAINANHLLTLHYNQRSAEYRPKDDLAEQHDIEGLSSDLDTSVTSFSYEAAILDRTLVNDAGVKRYQYRYNIPHDDLGQSGNRVSNNNSDTYFGYYESIRYSPLNGLFLKVSMEKAYRLPNTEEAFGNGINIVSSADIKPEKSDNFNVGFLFDQYDIAGLSWLKVEANYFYRDVRDMIKLGPTGRSNKSSYRNLGEIEVKGYEVEFKTDINDAWYVYGAYTNQELKNQQKYAEGTISSPNPLYGLDVPNIAKQYLSAGVEYKHFGLFVPDSMLKLFWETNWVDEYYYGWEMTRHQSRKIDAQIEHAAGFLYSFHDDEVHIGFDIKNITDEKLNDVYNYPLMGRSYNLTLRYSWFE